MEVVRRSDQHQRRQQTKKMATELFKQLHLITILEKGGTAESVIRRECGSIIAAEEE